MSNYPFETFPLTKRIGIVNPVANLDARYGPWPTFNDALTGFSSAVRQRGLTIAVSGVGGIVEYWYKDGIADNNLVLKSSDITEADILPTVTNYLSTNIVLLSAFTASAPCVIQTNTTTPTLRINQAGLGPALVVEDATTPDSTPIVIDQHGTLIVGASAYTENTLQQKGAVFVSSSNTIPSKAIVELRYHGTEGDLTSILDFIRLRSNSSTTYTGTFPLSANDVLGLIRMRAGQPNAGTTAPGFTIEASVKNSSSTGAISGTRVRFTTHVAQSNSMYNVLTLDENRVGIGTTVPTEALTVVGNISGNNLRTSFNQGSAIEDWSFAVGSGRASGIYSHAEGELTLASGQYSHAEGSNTIASGAYSHAEGNGTLASGQNSHAEGSTTKARGGASHAEGFATEAFGNASHAEGSDTQANGNASHAAGRGARVNHDYSYLWSDGGTNFLQYDLISTTKSYQYMISASGGVFIPGRVGIGTDSVANALTVVGNISATGAVYSNLPLRILASNETNLNTDLFTTFVKLITAPNTFTFTNFTSGKTITLYLCAGHLNFSRHYFPQTTYISEAGEGNTVYTFENYITKVTLQNVGTQFIGTTDIIPINIEQIIPLAPIGASIILEDRLGYLKQEDGSYILL